MARYTVFAFLVFLLLGCGRDDRTQERSDIGSRVTAESQTSPLHLNANEDPLPHSDGWVIGRVEGVPTSGSRFEAGGDRYGSGFLVVHLDTALKRAYPGEPPHERSRADSLIVTGLAVRETFAQLCRVAGTLSNGQTAGLMRDTVTEKWLQPRLAWFFDTVNVRIRALPTDSVSCMLEMPD